jgi:hypothetical protein
MGPILKPWRGAWVCPTKDDSVVYGSAAISGNLRWLEIKVKATQWLMAASTLNSSPIRGSHLPIRLGGRRARTCHCCRIVVQKVNDLHCANTFFRFGVATRLCNTFFRLCLLRRSSKTPRIPAQLPQVSLERLPLLTSLVVYFHRRRVQEHRSVISLLVHLRAEINK